MKCPKCGYLGFETSDRCRNCGYDFTLVPEAPAVPDLPLRPGTPLGPLSDLALDPHDELPASLKPGRQGRADFDLARDTPAARPQPPDLPLFEETPARPAEPSLIPVAPPPRPPLSVRRATPPPARVRSQTPRSAQVDLDLQVESAAGRSADVTRPAAGSTFAAARPGQRVLAAAVDALILVPIDLVVIYFTLRLCRLTLSEITLLPALPLLAFFAILDGGYLVAFTAAGGQTIGKMAAGIRVVTGASGRVGTGRALARALASVVSVVPLGIGLLPAAFDAERRTLHDRIAGTRVVVPPAS